MAERPPLPGSKFSLVGLKQLKYAPSALFGERPQARIRVGRDRAGRLFQQRQIVQRIGVKRRFDIVPAHLARRQPLRHALDLAFPERRRAADFARHVVRALLSAGRDPSTIVTTAAQALGIPPAELDSLWRRQSGVP